MTYDYISCELLHLYDYLFVLQMCFPCFYFKANVTQRCITMQKLHCLTLYTDQQALEQESPNIMSHVTTSIVADVFVVCRAAVRRLAMHRPESEKPRRRVGIADREVFARLESFCAYLQYWLKINSKHSRSLEGFQTVWIYIGQFGKFPEGLESFHTVWKVSGQSGKFPDSLESVLTVWKVSGQSGKCPDSLESFQTVWKVSRPICKRQRYRVFFVTVAPPKSTEKFI